MVILAALCFLAPESAERERHWMGWPPVTRWRICVSLLTFFWDMRSAAFLFYLAVRSALKLTADDSSGLHMCANDQWEPAMSAKGAERTKGVWKEKRGQALAVSAHYLVAQLEAFGIGLKTGHQTTVLC
jgi:hypothetical protein